jgi:DNA-binding transcriptional ArsR family regulator
VETTEVADVAVLDDRDAAAALIDPLRARILTVLAEPGSATTVAAALGLTRQQVNYHVRALEACGLVTLVEERPRRGVTERVVQATARSYVVSPAVLGELAANPARLTDRLSARYVVALASRTVREVGALASGADRAGRKLATLAIDTEIRFADAAQRAAFTEALAEAVRSLVATYHDESSPGGRHHRLVVTAYPTPKDPEEQS